MNVIVLSNVPLGTWVAMRVLRTAGLTLKAVVCDPRPYDFRSHGLPCECVYDFASRLDIPMLGLDDLSRLVGPEDRYVGLSVRFGKILRPAVFGLFSHGVINLHGGELPRYRGMYIPSFCILEGAVRGGATLHYIDEGVDTGPIIRRESFDIDETDTAHDLFLKTQSALMRGFEAILPRLGEGRLPATPQQVFFDRGETARVYRLRDLDPWRVVGEGMSLEEIDRRARAFEFPGHEPAYFELGERRVYVTTRWNP